MDVQLNHTESEGNFGNVESLGKALFSRVDDDHHHYYYYYSDVMSTISVLLVIMMIIYSMQNSMFERKLYLLLFGFLRNIKSLGNALYLIEW